MKITADNLIEDLIERTHQNLNENEELLKKSFEELNWKADPTSWSALECIEHLNRYGQFYLPEIKDKIKKSRFVAEPTFKSGLLGNYFAKSMLPREKLNKMKTFNSMNPSGSQLGKEVIEEFIAQQKHMLQLLDRARQVSLNRTKTAISISNLIKLRLGDTFRVVIYHNQRHVVQALTSTTNYRSLK